MNTSPLRQRSAESGAQVKSRTAAAVESR
jgi:hypothetical protein